MYKIAAVGDRDSVLGFRALGLDTFFCDSAQEAGRILASPEQYAVIYVTEALAQELDLEKYAEQLMPAVIVIPGKQGNMGMGMASLKAAVERAVGADIMNT